MIRVLVENVLLFLAPTAIYVAYVLMTRDRQGGSAGKPGHVLEEAPLIWLFAAGAFLVIATLIAFGSYSGGKPGEIYQPPTMKDGYIERGHKVSP